MVDRKGEFISRTYNIYAAAALASCSSPKTSMESQSIPAVVEIRDATSEGRQAVANISSVWFSPKWPQLGAFIGRKRFLPKSAVDTSAFAPTIRCASSAENSAADTRTVDGKTLTIVPTIRSTA